MSACSAGTKLPPPRKALHNRPNPESHFASTFMNGLPVLLAEINDLWYALPLIVSVSLVYAATRHEATDEILRHAARIGAWIVGFMLIVFLVLWVISNMVSAA